MTTDRQPAFQRDHRGYDPETDTYHAHHDRTGPDPLWYTVSAAVAAITGDDITERSPLPEGIDLEALDELFPVRARGGRPTDHVMVTLEECRVTIYRTGHIVVRTPDSETAT